MTPNNIDNDRANNRQKYAENNRQRMITPDPRPHPQRCIHYKVCVLNNALIREILPKGKVSFLWCEDGVRMSNEGVCSHSSAGKLAQNPCDENGCTDIETCDEICQNSRIYSSLQMEEAKKQAASEAREKVLDALCRDFKGRYVEDAINEIRQFPESLRSGQP